MFLLITIKHITKHILDKILKILRCSSASSAEKNGEKTGEEKRKRILRIRFLSLKILST